MIIADEDFKQHVYTKYVSAIVGGGIFPYPPETLYAALSLDGDFVERKETSDVWAIGVLLFIFLGGSKITLLKLVDYTKRADAL